LNVAVDAVAEAERTRPSVEGAAPGARPVDPDLWLLHVRFAGTGDGQVLADLVEEYTAYALSWARRYLRSGIAPEDLDQVALEALVLALRRFDPSYRLPFVAFATPTIVGALRRHYRDHGWALRVPRLVHDLAPGVGRATDVLHARVRREPTAAEIAEHFGCDEATVLTVQRAVAARSANDLDVDIVAGSPDPRLAAVDDHLSLAVAMRRLDDRQRRILGLYFYEGLTQSAIADRYGVSQMQVSRWLSATLRQLRAHMGDEPRAA
jgi:RNA polymerase sigma-B factor